MWGGQLCLRFRTEIDGGLSLFAVSQSNRKRVRGLGRSSTKVAKATWYEIAESIPQHAEEPTKRG